MLRFLKLRNYLLLASMIIACAVCSPDRQDGPAGDGINSAGHEVNAGEPAHSGKPSRLVFLTTSKGCACTMRRCQGGEDALKKTIGNFKNLPTVERIDYAVEPQKMKDLISKYPASIPPVLYLIASDGTLVEKIEGEFGEGDLERLFVKYWERNVDNK